MTPKTLYAAGEPHFIKRHKHLETHFHANDDPPLIRDRMFELVLKERSAFRFSAVVIDRLEYLNTVIARRENEPDYKYVKNDEYDYLVRLLLRGRLHKEMAYLVTFSRRGADRSRALMDALVNLRKEMCAKLQIADGHYILIADCPEAKEHGALQLVDYCLWALQRLYNRHESRYIELIWPVVTIINDRHLAGGTGGKHFYGKEPSDVTALKDARGI